jgi:uncharacterized RDD family membrane protein YckC
MQPPFRRRGKTSRLHPVLLHIYDSRAWKNLTLRIAVNQFKPYQRWCPAAKRDIFETSTLTVRGASMANCKNCGFELPEGAVYCPRCGTAVSREEAAVVATGQPEAQSSFNLALWWERFVAWIIDVAIIWAFGLILGFFALLAGSPFDFSNTLGWPSWISLFFNFSLEGVFLFLYWMFMEGSSGQSFGKIVMRLKVVRSDGTPINMGWAAVESAGKAFFLPLDLLIGWILYTRRRQRVFNYLSQTVVVKAA